VSAALETTQPLRLTVFGCEHDEAALFRELAPTFGVAPIITRATASAASATSVRASPCISVGHKSKICGLTLLALKRRGVQYICTRSVGLDHIDLAAAATLGLTVENVVYAPDGVADYAVMLMLMAVRNAKAIVSAAQQHDFRLSNVRGKELRDLTVGVVGVGNIGQAVIQRLQGFGCRVLAYTNGRTSTAAVDFVALDELLRASDVITLHLPLTAETHHFIGRKQIDAMKDGAILVNTGRGTLVDTDALIAALERGKLDGAALDVLEGEEGLFYLDCTSEPIDNHFLLRLQELPNAIVTPHTAYYTRRALYDTVEATLLNCRNFARTRGNE
jgi:D-specific alpha-keto acid dehydrogenase